MSDFMSDAVGKHIRNRQPWPPRLWILNKRSDETIGNVGDAARSSVRVSGSIAKDISLGCHFAGHLLNDEDSELWLSILHLFHFDADSPKDEAHLPLRLL